MAIGALPELSQIRGGNRAGLGRREAAQARHRERWRERESEAKGGHGIKQQKLREYRSGAHKGHLMWAEHCVTCFPTTRVQQGRDRVSEPKEKFSLGWSEKHAIHIAL